MSMKTIWEPFDPGETLEQFQAKRKNAIGSSDIADVFDVGDYGCRRRLFLDRLGTIGEGKSSFHLERGRFFEGPVAALYEARTGRSCERVGTGRLADAMYMAANADRLIRRNGMGSSGQGILEIKCPAAQTFRKVKREGLLENWILQIQYQLLCYDLKWASVAVFWADGFELEHFDIERDEELCRKVFDGVKFAWNRIEFLKTLPLKEVASQLPEKKDEHSKACARCPFFVSCHGGSERKDRTGSVVLEHLEPLVAEYQALKEEEKSLESRKDELKGAIQDAFGESFGKIQAGRFTVSITECTREGFDSAACKKDLGERAQKYVKLTKYERMLVKEQK